LVSLIRIDLRFSTLTFNCDTQSSFSFFFSRFETKLAFIRPSMILM